ncbi:unnamed protein product, partial [Chrysoparadoxa australica]
EGAAEAAAEAAEEAEGTFFDDIKTSLPGLDMFDPSVFDLNMVVGVLVTFMLVAVLLYKVFIKLVIGEDNFFNELGISYSDFELPDEINEFYTVKEELLASGKADVQKLRNALLKRAVADIPGILRMQNEGPGMHSMYQQTMIGEKEWRNFQIAEQLVSDEVESVQAEAEEIEAGWSQQIWPLAMQLRQVLQQRQQ